MEIPFYYSFKEFEKNYNDDLKNWFANYPDASENDFLSEVQELYNPFVRWNVKYHFIEIKKCVKIKKNIKDDKNQSENPKKNTIVIRREEIDGIPLLELCKVIDSRFFYFFNSNPFFHEDFDDKPLRQILYDCEILDIIYNENYKKSIYGVNDDFIINYQTIKNIEEFVFFNFDKNNDFEPFFCFDERKYKNFGFAVVRIAKWIDEKLSQKDKSETIINNTQEDTDEETQNKFNIPQIIKILDKLNIKGMMQEKGFTDFQTVQLLADIFERSEKSIRNNFDNQLHTTTAENYISDLKKLTAKR